MGILFAAWLAALGTIAYDNQDKYDAPVPQRCATFHDRYDVDNREFCDDWMAKHAAPRHETKTTAAAKTEESAQ